MIFTDPKDEVLHVELLREEVYTNSTFNALRLPHEGKLLDALRANATAVDGNRWCHWLVVKHGCVRVPNMEVDRFFLHEMSFVMADLQKALHFDVYPLKMHTKRLMVGCARPMSDDASRWVDTLNKRTGASRFTKLALSLSESHSIRTALQAEYSNQVT